MKTVRASADRGSVLHVKVGDSLAEAGARAAAAMKALQRGESVEPYFGVSFSEVGQMFAAFTPRRWELIAALREQGPLTVAELARRLGRNYKNVHGDVTQLVEWMAVERDADGQVHVPWTEIIVDMKLPQRQAA
jgi:predicted transcriptional regulator